MFAWPVIHRRPSDAREPQQHRYRPVLLHRHQYRLQDLL